jgi:hypothetical protein
MVSVVGDSIDCIGAFDSLDERCLVVEIRLCDIKLALKSGHAYMNEFWSTHRYYLNTLGGELLRRFLVDITSDATDSPVVLQLGIIQESLNNGARQ